MRVLAGVVPPTSGTVTVAGRDIRKDTLAVKQLAGYCPDVGGLVPRATPWEHLQLSAKLRRLTGWEDHARELLERFELGDAMNRVTGGFSHGMGRRLSVVLAAMHKPQVLLLDEPFDGVDPIGVEATFEVIADARARGATILLSTHFCATWRSRHAAPRWCSAADRALPRSTQGDGRRGGGSCLPRSPRLKPARRYSAQDTWQPLVVPSPTSAFSSGSASRPYADATSPGCCRWCSSASRWVPRSYRRSHQERAASSKAFDILLLVPSAMACILVLNMLSAVASGGGRELISRDHAGPHPIGPTTDHLGALLLAPLNIAWMVQAWVLLGRCLCRTIAEAVLRRDRDAALVDLQHGGRAGHRLVGGGDPAWSLRDRRSPARRSSALALGARAPASVHGELHDAPLDRVPTLWVFTSALGGWSWTLGEVAVALVVGGVVVAAVLGAVPRTSLRVRMRARLEARMETDQHEPRKMPAACWGSWSAPTGHRSGARCRCVVGCWSSPSARVWSRCSATSTGRR